MTTEETSLELLMEQQRRQLLVARMLPEGPLTDAQRAEVRAAVIAYCAEHDIKKVSLAKQMGFNPSVASQILSDTYGKDRHGNRKVSDAKVDQHLRDLNDWMEVDARRRQSAPKTRYIETRVATRILGAAQHASQHHTIMLCHGPTGIGKSMVAHVMVEKFPGAIYLRISRGNASYQAVRRMLATRLRIKRLTPQRSDSGSLLTPDERIFERLRDSHRFIIIDEAHRLANGALEFLRDVYDETNVPMLLLCTVDLLERIRKDADEDHGQLYSRFGHTCDLTKECDKEPGGKHPLFTYKQIRALFESDVVRLANDAVAHLWQIANHLGFGSLRTCVELMRWAVAVERVTSQAGPRGKVTISAALLRKVEQEAKADATLEQDMRLRTAGLAATA